ncbi:hypothetical protein [Actinoplanes sp. NPDC049599]|uniref:hypothetical protein n=1 Tax=Actinoplanes sp. NPDC049599 TaxID=3363903 RepID=UPI0037B29F69
MNPVLLGDEMLRWSEPAVARGAAFGSLVAAAPGGRTLVAGPHHPDLIAQVPADGLTLLVRGVDDAEALAGRFPAATVCCGGLAKFTADTPFDTVIALAGLERLISAEGVEQPWGQTLDQLLALLRPGGTLVLAVENHFGLHRLVRLPGGPRDDEWTAAAGHDPTRPRGLDQLRERLGGPVRGLVGYPDPLAPTLLLGAGVLADDRVAGAVAALLTQACAAAGPVLLDPRPVAVGAARHGAAAALAPAWICTSGPVPEPALPAGPTLQDLLLRAALARDLPAVRELLGSWLDGPAAGVPADQVVVGPDATLTALLPAEQAAAAAGDPGEALRRLAAFLIDGGYPHPWPAPAGAADLAGTLAAMTGRELEVPEPADEPPLGYRELLLARERLTTELAQARARHHWYERMLTDREAELTRVRRINLVLGAAAPGRALLSGAKAVRRAVRRVRRR